MQPGHPIEERYRTLFEYAPIGIVYADAESYYLEANEAICQMLGYTREEFIGLHASDIVLPAEIEHIDSALHEIHADQDHRREWQFRRKDGTTLLAEVIATKFPDGTLLGLIRDITAIRAHEREQKQLTRLYAALSQVNQAIVWSRSREELFEKVCQALVVHGGLGLAWIGWRESDGSLRPIAHCGEIEPSELLEISSHLKGDARTILSLPITERFSSTGHFSVHLRGEVCASLIVHTGQLEFFQSREVALLEEAAMDLSFALENQAREDDRQRAEEILQSEKAFSDTMIESLPGIFYFYNEQGRFLRWNKNFETVSGYSGAEIAQMHPKDFFARSDHPALAERIAEVFTRGQSYLEANFLSKDGTSTYYFFTGRRLEFRGQACLIGVGIDISERRRIEEEREHRLRAEEADRVKSSFLATMSHELRTPLNSIIGFTGILTRELAGPLNEEQRTQLGMVQSSAHHLLSLVNDVLDISRIEAHQLKIAHDPFDPGKSIQKVLDLMRPQAENKKLELKSDLPRELGIAMGDERRFEQILLNLLSNAVKFTQTGTIMLSAELAETERACRIEVKDTGMGIKPEDMANLFEPFRQLDSGLTRKHEGTGLGLAICRRLAALMGGEITVTSIWGKGSTFTLVLPLERPGGDQR